MAIVLLEAAKYGHFRGGRTCPLQLLAKPPKLSTNPDNLNVQVLRDAKKGSPEDSDARKHA